ncbi:hotdog fold thioesterase [Halioxenophilus sp. WMMB6]|uniref:hotdog fold thioesterase n=1 Tax=Halioxenophilus sp. WMMB6 TaxID=3073815 RepID=UPI00295E7B43|nr:hotdog fold thioesterase [Halioxenophilus sp. WMMB6]
MSQPIWFQTPTSDHLQTIRTGTIEESLGIEITEIGPDYIRGTLPADQRTFQPTGRIHGGANVVLAESLGSLGANLVVDQTQYVCFGMEVNANHLRGVSQGKVTGTARPLHLGKTTHVWEIKIHDDDDQLTCISRLTMAVVRR